MTVTPHVTADGSVLLNMKVMRDEPDFNNTGARGDPTILKRKAETELLVSDGHTAVIGGIYVIENPEWNAFAMGNYSIYVFSGLLDALDDDVTDRWVADVHSGATRLALALSLPVELDYWWTIQSIAFGVVAVITTGTDSVLWVLLLAGGSLILGILLTILIGLVVPGLPRSIVEEHLDELERLVEIRKKGEEYKKQKELLARKIDLITELKKQQAVPVHTTQVCSPCGLSVKKE